MKDLFKAIYGRYAAAPGGVHNALYQLIPDKLFNSGAPVNTALPLVTMSLVSNTVDQLMEKCLVQFSIFSSAPADTEVLALYDALIALYDNCELAALGNPSNMGMERSFCQLFHEDNVWHYVVEYEVWVERR